MSKIHAVESETTYKIFSDSSMVFSKYMGLIVKRYFTYDNRHYYTAKVFHQKSSRHTVKRDLRSYQEAEDYITENYKE